MLGPADVPGVIALHRRVLASLAPGLLNPETDAFFAQHAFEAGRLFGLASSQGALVAYAVLGLPTASDIGNFGRLIGLAESELGLVAHLDGAAVVPEWRGHGLQRALLVRRVACAVCLGRRHLLATVAPANHHSLRNATGLGLRIIDTRPMFAAGALRHILHLDLAQHIPAAIAGLLAPDARGTSAQDPSA
jgi:ribosomal protein S18 acetylase RimI-like enzyme